jgi:hypothetical protein
MSIILLVLDFVVVLFVVFSVSRAVWTEASGRPGAGLLSVCVVAALAIFGLTSLMGAFGLTEAPAFDQGALVLFLVAIVIVTLLWRAKKSATPAP